MPTPQTSSGTPKLSELARHVVIPSGIVATGWPAVREQCLKLGVKFDPWQDGVGRLTLAKRADGKYAAGVGGVVLSIPRQIGKTYTVGAIVFALCILFPGLTVIWTAHRLKTAGETFRSMQGMARRQRIAPYVEQIFTGSGDEEVRFRNGSRILFGARERGFGRGFAEVDVEVFDEAQILGERALDDMIPATNQSKQPAGALLFFIGTPPKPDDPSEAFTAKRAKALTGKSADMVYVEFSADRDADLDDRKQWAKANASFPQRTSVEAMQRMRENLSDDAFRREAMGVWDEDGGNGKIPRRLWDPLADPESGIDGRLMFAVAIPYDGLSAVIGVAGERDDGLQHLEVVDARRGSAWVAARLAALIEEHRADGVVIDPGGPSRILLPDLLAAGIEPIELTIREYAQACGALYATVTSDAPTVRHLAQPELDLAINGAKARNIGDLWAWSRKDPTVDISPLEAVTLAWHGLMTTDSNDPAANVW